MAAPAEGPATGPGEQAERIFLDGLACAERVDVEALCRRHPGLVAELRGLQAAWELASRLGEVALEPGPAGEGAAPRAAALSAIHARLSAQGAAADRYRDEGEIARGAQGVVRRAFDATLQRHVAMKVQHARDAAAAGSPRPPGSSRRLGRFLEEAQVTAQLEHPGIVPVHELGLDAQGAVYFTMKLVKGRSLHEILHADGGPAAQGWTTTRLVGALVRVAEAMAFAHDRGVVHRDLKPANIMLGDYGEVYVMDWGLARLLDAEAGAADPAPAVRSDRRAVAHAAPDSSLLTLDGDVVGTPQYMAPEQATGRLAQLGPATDVYALGAMLYHVLAGRAPYATGQGSSPAELLDAVRSRPPAPLHQLAAGVPPELEAICEKAMARQAGRRYASMAELAADLRAFLESRVVRAYETGPLAELRKWVRRNRALTAAGAGVLLAVLGGLLYASRVEAAGRRRAEGAQQAADRNLADVLRLSDVQRLDRLRRDADALWPADTAHVDALQAWLDDARALLGRTDAHRATLEALRSRALPYTPEDEQRDRDDPQLAEELQAERDSLAALRPMLAWEDAHPDGDPSRRNVILRKMAARQAAIDRVQARRLERRTWRFAAEEDAWWHATLASLLDGLQRFGDVTLSSVEQRLQRAQDLERISLRESAGLWAEAVASIADPAQCPLYGGLRLAPQPGLVPLGRNAGTGLWEFWDVQLGDRPVRGADGRYALVPESGLLFVLLPGGVVPFGGQCTEASAACYDPSIDAPSSRVQEVRLDPFFISAFELTQAQGERALGRNTSIFYSPNTTGGNEFTETNPLESETWIEALTLAQRFGCVLPTEAQWEYACRGGTTTRWWTGADVASLQGAANVADAWLAEHGGEPPWPHEPSLNDGYATHAPVGSYRPNAFGLYDMIGNVSEWTRDAFTEGAQDAAPGDGGRTGGNAVQHPTRGGSWGTRTEEATSAYRGRVQSDSRSGEVGLRLVRRVQPDG